MLFDIKQKTGCGLYITFSGNCRKALTFYQSCFGGRLHFDTLDVELPGYRERPVVNGSLISEQIVIHGSDLVHNEGRKVGNYLSVFLHCDSPNDRKAIVQKLGAGFTSKMTQNSDDQSLIEITDPFEVKWVLGV